MTTLETQPTSKEREASQPGASHPRPFRLHVIGAVFKRNLLSYFSNPAGYVFITLFVLISSCVAFWQDIFFTSNLANLDQLNRYMPYLLLFFIPAVTMSLWADERRLGTDELLLTLPAHDLDIVLGKYLAALGIFTVALAFSLSHVYILRLLGGGDYGIILANYLGYWLMGAMLVALGMVASLLSSNVTVAFILGALFCAVPIFLDWVGSPTLEFLLKNSGLRYLGSKVLGMSEAATAGSAGRLAESWSVPARFQDFGRGVITLSGFLYFLGIAAAMLYLNMMLLGRRHWAGGEASSGRWLHSVVRLCCVLLALFSLTVMIDLLGLRVDASEAKLHTLSPGSLEMIQQIPADRPVMIQCYYSPDVPREYIETKATLLGLLREYAARSGGRIRLDLVPSELYSVEARDAEKRFGIEPRKILSSDQAKQMAVDIIMGVAFTSGLEEVVIPFFDRGLPTEYELTRSIRVVSRSGRKKLGILTTDAKITGGFDMRTFNPNPEWSVVTELKKQYEVSTVAPDAAIPGDIDALMVAQPSSLTQKQIDNLADYIRKGGATLLFLDPAPVENPSISPEIPKMPPGGPFGGGQPPEPKGNLRPLLEMCGIEWPSASIVWNDYNPHPQLPLPREVVFVKDSNDPEGFNQSQTASSGLQEIVTLWPGLLRSRSGSSGIEFTPLARSSRQGGTLLWSDVFQQSFMGVAPNPRPRDYILTGENYTLAARITGQAPAESETAKKDADKKEAEKKDQKPGAKLNVIAIADLDMIGQQFFELRNNKELNLDLDNITFVLNCVDVLAGDETFIPLRKKRPRHHTLQALEKQTGAFYEELDNETKLAGDEARKELADARREFDKEVDRVRNNPDLDDRSKESQLDNLQKVAQRRLDVKTATIEDAKQARIRESRTKLEQNTREIQNTVRFEAAALPPLPPLFLGLCVWYVRRKRENVGANPTRLA